MKPLHTISHLATRTRPAQANGGMEIGLLILLFVLLGVFIDSKLGTRPVFVIGLFLFAAITSGLRYYYVYSYDMDRLEAERRAARVRPDQAVDAEHSER